MTSRMFITVKALHFKGKPDCTFPSGDCPGTLACPVVLGSLGLVRSLSSYAGFWYSSMSRRAFSSLDCCGWVTLLCHMQKVLREVCVSPRAFGQSLFSLLELLGDIPSPDYSVYAVDRHFFSSVSLFSVPCSDDHEQIFWTCNSGLRVTFDADYASIASQYRNSYYLVLCTTVWHASVEKHRNRVAFTLLICERGPKGFPPPEGCFIRNASMLKKYCLKCLI
ncbi:unnamed protein product [Ixodes persulcatus]